VETPPFIKLPIENLHNVATKKPKKKNSNKANRVWSCFEVELDLNYRVSKCKRRSTSIGFDQFDCVWEAKGYRWMQKSNEIHKKTGKKDTCYDWAL